MMKPLTATQHDSQTPGGGSRGLSSSARSGVFSAPLSFPFTSGSGLYMITEHHVTFIVECSDLWPQTCSLLVARKAGELRNRQNCSTGDLGFFDLAALKMKKKTKTYQNMSVLETFCWLQLPSSTKENATNFSEEPFKPTRGACYFKEIFSQVLFGWVPLRSSKGGGTSQCNLTSTKQLVFSTTECYD